VARLIRTEKEVEGRYEEVFIVVEEDALEQWPAGPREVVGQPATRVDGFERASGQAVYTADLQKPGMLHAAVLRSPHPRARATVDVSPALDLAGVHAAVGPGEIEQLSAECNYQGQAIAAVCADTLAQARAAVHAIRCDFERGLAQADVVVEAEFRTQVVLHNSMETHQAVVEWTRDDAVEVHISTQYVWGIRDAVAEGLGLPADNVRVVCRYMGGGFGS
jgi:xanthine dehydrogenase YagR molybdenum-binding subunit